MEDELTKFLETAAEWATLETSMEGVVVRRMPPYKGQPARLSVEINPTGKRRGIFVRNHIELEILSKVLGAEEVSELVKTVEQVNPEPVPKAGTLQI